jgi:hypothetical protein
MIPPGLRFKQLVLGNPLKPVSLAGLLLALILSWALVFYSLAWDEAVFPDSAGSGSSFARELEKYDAVLYRESPSQLERRLAGLEKRAKNQEERLSTLKRRRDRAREDPGQIPAYQKSAQEAAGAFPYSAFLAAVAVEAILLTEPKAEDIALLKTYAARMTRPRFTSLLLCVHVLLGDLEDPAKAALVPGMEDLFSAGLFQIPLEAKEDLLIDEILLRAIREDNAGTAVRINNLVQGNPGNRTLLKLGAEYFYDNGNPLRAAELFSRLGDDASLAREADALALAGEIPAARNIWKALSSAPTDGSFPEIRARSLYNLAATAGNEKETAAWLEKLFAGQTGSESPEGKTGAVGLYGTIRYTRLQDTARSIAILEESNSKNKPLLDLELLRRRLDIWPPGRSTAEVWLLLGRHPGSEALFQWAAAYFDRQKLYDETAQLLKIAASQGITGPWTDLHYDLALIRAGKTAEAEKLLRDAIGKSATPDWRIPANLARILESRRSISAALKQYEIAATLVKNPGDASLIQLRISRCLEALGQPAEGRLALEKALALDPDNLNARYELQRIDSVY